MQGLARSAGEGRREGGRDLSRDAAFYIALSGSSQPVSVLCRVRPGQRGGKLSVAISGQTHGQCSSHQSVPPTIACTHTHTLSSRLVEAGRKRMVWFPSSRSFQRGSLLFSESLPTYLQSLPGSMFL